MIRAVAALDDELRRGMYTFIRAARRSVTRDEAATAVGISRELAAFHVDKLVGAGVPQADYRPASGIDGLVADLDATSVRAELDPRAGECCVDIRA